MEDLYLGAIGDGFNYTDYSSQLSDYYIGGVSDGFSSDGILNNMEDLYLGGVSDGSNADIYLQNFTDIFRGGFADGYGIGKIGQVIVWTGTTGTGWNVATNWTDGLIPNLLQSSCDSKRRPQFPLGKYWHFENWIYKK